MGEVSTKNTRNTKKTNEIQSTILCSWRHSMFEIDDPRGNKTTNPNLPRSSNCKKINGVNSTLLVRRVFQGIGIERVFLAHSPLIHSIQICRSTKVRRAKLYYLRRLKGKAARLRERVKTNLDLGPKLFHRKK